MNKATLPYSAVGGGWTSRLAGLLAVAFLASSTLGPVTHACALLCDVLCFGPGNHGCCMLPDEPETAAASCCSQTTTAQACCADAEGMSSSRSCSCAHSTEPYIASSFAENQPHRYVLYWVAVLFGTVTPDAVVSDTFVAAVDTGPPLPAPDIPVLYCTFRL